MPTDVVEQYTPFGYFSSGGGEGGYTPVIKRAILQYFFRQYGTDSPEYRSAAKRWPKQARNVEKEFGGSGPLPGTGARPGDVTLSPVAARYDPLSIEAGRGYPTGRPPTLEEIEKTANAALLVSSFFPATALASRELKAGYTLLRAYLARRFGKTLAEVNRTKITDELAKRETDLHEWYREWQKREFWKGRGVDITTKEGKAEAARLERQARPGSSSSPPKSGDKGAGPGGLKAAAKPRTAQQTAAERVAKIRENVAKASVISSVIGGGLLSGSQTPKPPRSTSSSSSTGPGRAHPGVGSHPSSSSSTTGKSSPYVIRGAAPGPTPWWANVLKEGAKLLEQYLARPRSSSPRPIVIPTPTPTPAPLTNLTPFSGGGVRSPGCECGPKKPRGKKKPRTVCFTGRFTETATGTFKYEKRKRTTCQPSRRKRA